MPILPALLLFSSAALAQLTFDVDSVKPSSRQVGPDYNNQLTLSPERFSAKNVTVRKLVAEAHGVQMRTVAGPNSLDENEYDVEARTGRPATREELGQMLRTLLAKRFELRHHTETRAMPIYEMTVDGAGLKARPVSDGDRPAGTQFRGTMRDFADFLAVQLSIPEAADPNRPAMAGGPAVPVIDKTGRSGFYDFDIDVKPELGTDMFTLWRRALPEKLGLKLDSRRGQATVVVVDSWSKTPTAN